MERQRVQSSNVAEVGYDEATKTLEVLFKNGGLYRYAHVPPGNYDALLQAPSLGSYLATQIKPLHPCERVAEQSETAVERLARELHEAGREAVERGLVVNNLGKPFMGWDEISEPAREGRRVQARYLLKRYTITLRVS